MFRRTVPAALAALATAAVLTLAGCAVESSGGGAGDAGGNGSGAGSGSGTTAASCTPSSLHTHAAGTLTVATDSPAYPPWFVDDKPTNGKGYESAVAYAVAKQLGYSAGQVKWVVAPFNSVIAPTPKTFDFDINEVSITSQRAKVVDFSSGYYDVAQVVVALKTDGLSKATTVSALKKARLGAQQGSTSFTAITDDIKPERTPLEFPTNNLAVQALKNGQIDGLVVDLPTGFYLTSAELTGAKLVGQLPVHGKPEQFGLVLEKGSSLTSCVTKAVDALRSNGTIAALTTKWLASAGAPELK